MRLFTGSSTGTAKTYTPVSIDLRDLVEGTDYAGYVSWTVGDEATVEIYDEDGPNETKCVSFQMLTTAGLDAVMGISSATELCPQMEIVKNGTTYEPSLPFISKSGSEPQTWQLHSRDWWYRDQWQESSGGDTEKLYGPLCEASEVWTGTVRWSNEAYCNIFWTEGGGCFAGGTYMMKNSGVYSIAVSAGARVGVPPVGNVGYPEGDFRPRYRGVEGDDMFPDTFANNNKRIPSSWVDQITTFTELTNKVKLVLCTFKYNDEDYCGCAVLRFGSDDTLTFCGCWGISMKWWQSPGSKYQYTVNPDGTSKRAVNPNYTLSTASWQQSGLPGAGVNRLVTGPNFIAVDSVTNTPYGYATYSLSQTDFNTCIKDWTNKLSGFLGSMGSWWDRAKNAGEYISGGIQTLISNPIESILKVHTLPLTEDQIATLASSWSSLPYVRSGGCDSGVSTVGTLLDNDARIITVQCGTSTVGRWTSWASDWTHTSITVFVPFVGEIPLQPEDVLDHSLFVRYRIDVMTGDFIATVANEFSTFKTASGNMSIPIICASSATLQERALYSVAGAIQSGVQIAAASSAGNVPGMVAGLAGAAQSLTDSLQHHIAYSQIGGDGGLFSGLYVPFLIIRRPIPVTGDPTDIEGVVSGHIGRVSDGQVANASAFLSVIDIDLSGVDATEEEKNMIKALMRSGVYLPERT